MEATFQFGQRLNYTYTYNIYIYIYIQMFIQRISIMYTRVLRMFKCVCVCVCVCAVCACISILVTPVRSVRSHRPNTANYTTSLIKFQNRQICHVYSPHCGAPRPLMYWIVCMCVSVCVCVCELKLLIMKNESQRDGRCNQWARAGHLRYFFIFSLMKN